MYFLINAFRNIALTHPLKPSQGFDELPPPLDDGLQHLGADDAGHDVDLWLGLVFRALAVLVQQPPAQQAAHLVTREYVPRICTTRVENTQILFRLNSLHAQMVGFILRKFGSFLNSFR